MEKVTKCDGCSRPIDESAVRLINGYKLHNTELCFYAYTQKVEKGRLKTGFTISDKIKKNKR